MFAEDSCIKSDREMERQGRFFSIGLTVLFILQPLMDVLSFWQDTLGMKNTLTLLIRMLLLAATVAAGWYCSRRRKSYILMAALLSAYTLLHCFFCWQRGYADPVGDLTNLIRIYQLPLTTFAFVSFFRKDALLRSQARRCFLFCLMIVLAVELLSVVTGTNPYTYANKEVGLLGWFYDGSAQSAILSMLIPVAVVCVAEKNIEKPLPLLAVTATGFGMLYAFATRLTYASLLGCGSALTVTLILLHRLQKRRIRVTLSIVLACTLLAAAGFNLSPMAENSRLLTDTRAAKAADIKVLIAEDRKNAENAGLTGEALETAALKSSYEKYLPGPTGRFGLEKTVKVYNYASDVSVLGDVRLQKITYSRMLLMESPVSARLFGLELAEMTWNGKCYDAENDFHGICYLCGYTGLVLTILFLTAIACKVLLNLIRDFKKVFSLEMAGWGISLICGLMHAYFTAGVLRRPNSSFYFAVCLAAVWVLTDQHNNAKHQGE